MVVLFAFALNLIGISGALAGLPSLFQTAPTASAQTHHAGPDSQTRHIGIKPCHHNLLNFAHVKFAHGSSVAQANTETNNGLCCTEDSQAEAMPTVLRSKRDRDWQSTSDESSKTLLLPFFVIDTSASPEIELRQQPTAQIAGLLGAEAQFLRTVRLLT